MAKHMLFSFSSAKSSVAQQISRRAASSGPPSHLRPIGTLRNVQPAHSPYVTSRSWHILTKLRTRFFFHGKMGCGVSMLFDEIEFAVHGCCD